MKNVSDKVVQYLEGNNAAFEQITHSSAGSAEEYRQTMGTRLEQQAKALFVRFKKQDSKGFVLLPFKPKKGQF